MQFKLRTGAVIASSVALASFGFATSASSAQKGNTTTVGLNTVVVPGVPTLAQLYKGTTQTPPTSLAPGAKGKSVWWISCDQETPSCSQPAAAAAQGAKLLGINFHVADGKFDAGGAFNTAMSTALAAKPNAILLYGVACQLVKGQLEQAKAEHVIVMGINTPDCSDSGGPQLFGVHMIPSSVYKTEVSFWGGYGAMTAAYLIDKTDGKAKVIDNAGSEPLQQMVDNGFRAELAKCKSCKVVATVPYDSATLTPNGPWIQAFRAKLSVATTANAVYIPWDVMMNELGAATAISTSGLKLVSAGGQGVSDGLAMVRAGLITAESSAESDIWSGYAGIDAANRALDNLPQVPEGEGFALLTAGHAGFPSATGSYTPSINFSALYLKAFKADGKAAK